MCRRPCGVDSVQSCFLWEVSNTTDGTKRVKETAASVDLIKKVLVESVVQYINYVLSLFPGSALRVLPRVFSSSVIATQKSYGMLYVNV